MALIINNTIHSTSSTTNNQPPIPTTQIKTKKRARFADEPIDDHPSSLSSFITFHRDDPPQKKLKPSHSPVDQSLPFDLSNLATDSQPASQSLYLSFINTAFNQRADQNCERYNQLLSQFDPLLCPSTSLPTTNSYELSLRRIQAWLDALTSVVSQLDRTHSTLLQKVLILPWTIFDDQFVNVYFRFLNALVSARSEWIHPVLERIVQSFHYRSIPLEYRSNLLPSSANRRLIYQRLHKLLRSILRLIPTLPSTLWPLLDSYFPNKREHRDSHVCYLSNLLKVGTYCPELNEKIIQLCIEKCLKIDVEIQVEVEDWEDDEGKLEGEIFGKSVQDPFEKSWVEQEPDSDADDDEGEEVDFDDLSSDDGGDHLDEDSKHKAKFGSKTPSPESIRQVKKLAAKLDGMLRCMFDHLQQLSFGDALKSPPPIESPISQASNSTSPVEQIQSSPIVDPKRQIDREVIFDLLLSNFESSILCTHRTRHIQFIIFWYSSLEPTFADSLLATLVARGLYETDNSIPVATKIASVSYIASLISRAKYINKHVTRHVVSLLCARLELGLNQAQSMPVNTQVIWYAIAQAIFYIFCFRWQDLLVEDEDDEEDSDEMMDNGLNAQLRIQFSRPKKFNNRWINSLKVIEKSIASSLNPLKICAETVVSQFAKVSHETNFIYCYDIMRRNESNNKHKRKLKMKASRNLGWSESSNSSLTASEASSTPDRPKSAPPTQSLFPRSSSSSSSTSSSISTPMIPTKNHEEMVKKLLVDSKIEVFFPFDPFKLPLSSIYIHHIYRDWKDHNHLDDDDLD